MPVISPAASPSRPSVAARPVAGSAIQALAAICLGFFVVGMAGFSHLDVVHNASHDTRHSNAFPCH
jgi:cobalt transporter subunit CbtB